MAHPVLLRTAHGPAGLVVLGAAAWLCVPGGAAWAQNLTVQPPIGTDTRIQQLRPQLEPLFAPPAPLSTTPAFTYTPAIGVDVGATDNANHVLRPRRGDLFTNITPSLLLNGDTARVRVNLSYSPTATIYASQSSQTRFNQFGNGSVLATIVPDAVFLDLRGSISEQSATGNTLNNGATNSFNAQNEVQTTTFSVTPYAEHRFGGYGTARLGYSFARTLQDAPVGQSSQQLLATQAALNALGTPGFGATGNLSTQRERASFASGENLGRFNDLLTVEAYQYAGGGSYHGAYRNQVLNELGYALTRRFTLLGGLGYQDIRYSGTPAIRIREPTFNYGFRYTPNPDSNITITYGRHDAISSVSFDGDYAPTARTKIIGRYTTGITTDLEDAQNVLSTTTVGPTGLLTDSTTGAPVGVGSLFGVQNGIFKVKRFSGTALLLQDRDSYSLVFTSEDRTSLTNTPSLVNNVVIPAGTSSSSLSASLSWQHDLSETLNSVATLQYSLTNNTQQFLVGGSGSTQRTFSGTAALNKQFGPTLSGSIRYTYTNQSGGTQTAIAFNNGLLNTGAYTENVVLVGLRKSF